MGWVGIGAENLPHEDLYLSADRVPLYDTHQKGSIVTGGPPGIAEHLTVASHSHNTRSRGRLQRPRARTNAEIRRLCFSGSEACNRLPLELHQLGLVRFKSRLKDVLLVVRCM